MAWLLTLLKSLLNPLNWIKLAKLISSITGVITLVTEYLKKREADKLKEKLEKASNQVDHVKQTQPDNLEAQADALCELEKVTNPNSNCDK